MAERSTTKSEISGQKRTIKLPPAIGDWTNYRPPQVLVKKIKTGLYGFDRLSREELDLALTIHYRFIQALLKHLSLDLSIGAELFSCQVEQTTYLNFARGINGQILQGKLVIPQIPETPQVFLDLLIVDSLINHAVGSRDLEPNDRSLTEAEKAALTLALNEYLPHYAAAFEQVFPAPLFSIVSLPDLTYDSAINQSATFVSFTADIAFNNLAPGRIIFGYTGVSLKKLIESFTVKDREKPLDFSRLGNALLNRLQVPVQATLGRTRLMTSDLNSLEAGDVVALDAPINTAIGVAVGDLFKILGEPGIRARKKAVRIASLGEEEVKITPPAAVTEEAKPPAAPATPPAAAEPAAEPAAEAAPETDLLAEEDFPAEDLFIEDEFPEDFPETETKEGA